MRGRDVAGRRRRHRRILCSPLEHDLGAVAAGTGVSDHLRFGNSLYRLQLAVTALLSNTGGDTYLRQSAGGGAGGMAMGLGADEYTDRCGDGGHSRSDRADPAWRPPRRDAGGGGAVGLIAEVRSQIAEVESSGHDNVACTMRFYFFNLTSDFACLAPSLP